MTHKLFAAFAALCLSAIVSTAYAVPAYPGWRTMTQPDGSTISLRQVGDEFCHYWMNEAGQTMTKNDNGYWEVTVAPNTQSAQLRRQAVNAARQSRATKMRKVGAGKTNMTKGIIILVNYTDITFKSGNNNAAFTAMMTDDSYSYKSAYPGSAHKYFYDQSNGQYDPQFDVYGPYTLSNNRKYYGANDNDGNDVKAEYMIKEACQLADNDGVDFSKYDLDKDGEVDFVYVFYAGQGEADSEVENSVWPHSWTFDDAGISLTCDGKKINLYACSSELNSNSERTGIATFCHEFSHVIGMPDYYDIDYGKNYENGLTPMEWTLMDGGSYNGDGYCPPNYSVFDKYYMGWVTPTILNSAQNVTITTDYTSGYQINSNGTLAAYNNTSTQYYLENRQQSGWDKALPGHGMLVWKVMYNQSAWDDNGPNDTNGTIRYGVLCADGAHTKSGNYWYADDGDTYPGTKNKLSINSSAPFTTYPITDISELNKTITFKFMGGAVATYAYTADVENCTVSSASGTIGQGSTLTLTFTADNGYMLNNQCFAITMGSKDLVAGTDFTYSNGTLSIPNVTNEIYVIAIAQEKVAYTITWNADGVITTSSIDDGALVLAAAPAACESGKVFMGWTKATTVNADGSGLVLAKDGDAVTAAVTYYAVYASKEEEKTPIRKGTSASASVTFKTADSDSNTELTTDAKLKSDAIDAYTGFSSFSATKAYKGQQGLKLGSSKATGSITCTLSKAITTKTITIKAAQYNTDDGKMSVTVNGSTAFGSNQSFPSSLGDVVISIDSAIEISSITVATSKKRGYINAISLSASATPTYTDYALSCGDCVTNPEDVITVTFDYNGNGQANTTFATTCSKTSTALPAPNAWEHYTCTGWYDAAQGGYKVGEVGETYTPTKDITLYAQWVEDAQYTVTFYNNGEVYGEAQSLYENDVIAQPTTDPKACIGYTFIGWTTASYEAGTAPTLVTFPQTVGKSNVNYYAVYGTGSKTSNEYTKVTNLAQLTDSASCLIVNNQGSALNTTPGATSQSASATISNPASKLIWTVKKVNDGYQFMAGDQYLGTTGQSNGSTLQFGGSYTTWTITDDQGGKSGAYNLVNKIALEYYNSTFKLYSWSTNYAKYYVTWLYVAQSTYATYTTDPSCTSTDMMSVDTDEPMAQKVLINGQVVIIRDGKCYSILGAEIK